MFMYRQISVPTCT